MLSDTKTKKINKMGPELLNAILVTKSSMVAKEEDCRTKPMKPELHNYERTTNYIKSMYAFKNV